MSETLDIIDQLPLTLAARLQSDPYFIDIPVVAADEGDVEAMIAAKQAVIAGQGGKSGVAVVVLQVIGDDEQTNIQFGPLTLHPAFQVIEQREINMGPGGTKKPARRVARRIVQNIKLANFGGLVKDMKPSKPCIIPVPANLMPANVKAYEVDFNCIEWADDCNMVQVASPIPAAIPNTNTFQITCATPNALIYYTTDGSYPWSGNSAAQVYTEPVAAPDGKTCILACAYLPGNCNAIPSNVQKANLFFE